MTRSIFAAALVLLLSTSASLALPADPGTTTTYHACAAYWNWNYPGDSEGAILGKVFHPVAAGMGCSAAPPRNRRVLIFANGNGFSHESYDYLAQHLAGNGFVVAVINRNVEAQPKSARMMISYLNALHRYWTFRGRLTTRVAFGGHSQGGEIALGAAQLLYTNPGLKAYPYLVHGVVALAPTDHNRHTLTASMTTGYLAIYGSADEDVYGGEARVVDPDPVYRTAFSVYDRAGGEQSHDLGSTTAALEKALVYVRHAPHFFTDLGVYLTPVKAYVTSFLRLKMMDQGEYRAFLQGAWRPQSVAQTQLIQQFEGVPRRVIDNFSNADPSMNALGDSVTCTNLERCQDSPLHQLDYSSPHDTKGLRISWARASTVRWGIPDLVYNFTGLRDVRAYTHLSFRAAQVYGGNYNTVNQDQDFHVRLYTRAGWSNKIRVSAHGRIPYPYQYHCASEAYPCAFWLGLGADVTKDAMTSVHIPLHAFTNVDLQDVRAVYFYFDEPSHRTGDITIDSLQFMKGALAQ